MSHYLGRVEVDIFGTAMFITGYSWLVIESLLHIQCSQLILKHISAKRNDIFHATLVV